MNRTVKGTCLVQVRFLSLLVSIQEEKWQLCIGRLSTEFREGATVNNNSVFIYDISNSMVSF